MLVGIPLPIVLMRAIQRRYTGVARALAADDGAADTPLLPGAIYQTVVVPSASLNLVALQTLAYARSIVPTVFAVHVTDDPDAIARRLASCATSSWSSSRRRTAPSRSRSWRTSTTSTAPTRTTR